LPTRPSRRTCRTWFDGFAHETEITLAGALHDGLRAREGNMILL
jgi:hypothetical protein